MRTQTEINHAAPAKVGVGRIVEQILAIDNVTLNIYLGIHVAWNLKEGAYCYAISGLDSGPRNIKYHDPVKISDSTPTMLAIVGLNDAIQTTAPYFSEREIKTLQINVFASTKDCQVLNAIRKVMSQISSNVASGLALKESHYSSKHSALMKTLERTGSTAWDDCGSIKFRVKEFNDKVKAGKTVRNHAYFAVCGHQPVEQLADIVDIASRRRDNG